MFARIPLRKSAKIVNANALQIDWNEVITKSEISYILGNPPFVGKHLMSESQGKDMSIICHNIKCHGVLDYVTGWYIKASKYIKNTGIKVAFVSTNSITQGEQVGILWTELLNKYDIKIHFAHRTFAWNNEARGKAHVHVVIIGFANFDSNNKKLYDYEDIKGDPHEIKAKNINPYLIDYKDILVNKRAKPLLPDIPPIVFGSKPVDGGNLMLSDAEKDELIESEPLAQKYIRPLIGAEEFINRTNRWCLWLLGISPSELKSMPLTLERVNKVKEYRLKSKKEPTKRAAQTPTLFAEIRHKDCDYLLIPLVSSERRRYIPMGFFDGYYIANNRCSIVPKATLYDFGVIMSEMHMTWTRYTCGRLESRYNYSNTIVYNNFPFPQNLNSKKMKRVEELAQNVLDTRAKYPDCSLAVLYNPETMPPDLVKAHNELDRAVDSCYGKTSFKTERERIEFLFDLYDKYAQLLINEKSK